MAAPIGLPALSWPANQHGPARGRPDLCRIADAAPFLLVSTTPLDGTSLFQAACCSGVAAHGTINEMDVIAAGRRGNKAGHQGRGLAMCSPASHSCCLRRREKPFQLVRKLRGAVERHPQSVIELAKIRVRRELPPIPGRIKVADLQTRSEDEVRCKRARPDPETGCETGALMQARRPDLEIKAGWRPAQRRPLVGNRPPRVRSALGTFENARDQFIEDSGVALSTRQNDQRE